MITLHGDLHTATQHYWEDVQERHKLSIGDKDRPVLPPAALFLAPDLFFGRLKNFRRIELTSGETSLDCAAT